MQPATPSQRAAPCVLVQLALLLSVAAVWGLGAVVIAFSPPQAMLSCHVF